MMFIVTESCKSFSDFLKFQIDDKWSECRELRRKLKKWLSQTKLAQRMTFGIVFQITNYFIGKYFFHSMSSLTSDHGKRSVTGNFCVKISHLIWTLVSKRILKSIQKRIEKVIKKHKVHACCTQWHHRGEII